ncbi:glyoxalase superfamily protein [Methylobacterium indicum]|uniref:Glyoxalase-related protein domain-containing protein n=1 Tax=Methylobacterium indicum TaxID=1775910 RepID=A0A8H8WY25_9HYPH|nr:glyoxalase superfamily protein [Methylobacterium indicum]BCM86494.1 hypothetical protein mvi_49550 [Methylobacterium indicum]
MTSLVTIADLKAQAKALREALSERGIAKNHTACLDEVARKRGFKDFRAAKAVLPSSPSSLAVGGPFSSRYIWWVEQENWIAVNDPYLRGKTRGTIGWRIGDLFHVDLVNKEAGSKTMVDLHQFAFDDSPRKPSVRVPFEVFTLGFRKYGGLYSESDMQWALSDGQVQLLLEIRGRTTMTWSEIEQFAHQAGATPDPLVWQRLIVRSDPSDLPTSLAYPHDEAPFEVTEHGREALFSLFKAGRISGQGTVVADDDLADDRLTTYMQSPITGSAHPYL